MTFLRSRSPFIVPTLLFRYHSNGLALAYFAKQHRYGCGEYNFSTDSNNEGNTSYAYEERWEIRFNELKEYKEKYGDTLVPYRYTINPQLGRWVRSQRTQYKSNQLPDERIHRLNEISFVWDTLEVAWEEMYIELKKYKNNYGDALVPQRYKDNLKLGRWVVKQRTQYKRNELSDERIHHLNEIGFVWDANEAAWEKMYVELKKYKRQNSDTLVPKQYDKNPQLGFWVDTQRQQYKRNQLSAERIHRLNEVAFVWDALEAAWEEMFQELTKYKREHGDTLVPHRYAKNPQLGSWVGWQRQQYKRNQISGKRIRRLSEIGFIWDSNEAAWEEMFTELKKYKQK
jgi:hypothetical protein